MKTTPTTPTTPKVTHPIKNYQTKEPSVTKTCTQCQETKEYTLFYKDPQYSDGRKTICNDCIRDKYNHSINEPVVYRLTFTDNTYYYGSTSDIKKRLRAHNSVGRIGTTYPNNRFHRRLINLPYTYDVLFRGTLEEIQEKEIQLIQTSCGNCVNTHYNGNGKGTGTKW